MRGSDFMIIATVVIFVIAIAMAAFCWHLLNEIESLEDEIDNCYEIIKDERDKLMNNKNTSIKD